MLDSIKSINFNKKSHFKPFVYVSYDTIQFIWYAHYIVWFMSTYYMPIRYRTFYTRYDTYCTILTTMVVTIKASQLFKSIGILNSSIKAILKLVYNWICFLKYLQTVYLKLITTWHFPSMLSAKLGNYNYCLTFCFQGWKSVIVIFLLILISFTYMCLLRIVEREINLNSIRK